MNLEDALAKIRTLEEGATVPCNWRCAKCSFGLTTPMSNEPGPRCPNCDVPLWRVTWRYYAEQLEERCVEQMMRAVKAEAEMSTWHERALEFESRLARVMLVDP